MNPQILFEIDISFLSSLISSENGVKKKKNEKIIHKKFKKSKILNKENISKKLSDKLFESDFTEEKIEDTSQKESQINNKNNDFLIIIKEGSDEENILNMAKKEKDIKKVTKERTEKKLINKKSKKTKEELLIYLVDYIKNVFIFRKKAKLLIQKHKENFAILNLIKKDYLPMNIQIDDSKKTILKYTYEPILNEYIFYFSRKLFNKNLIRFTFITKKNECVVEPKLETVYYNGEFYNVINLKKIRKIEKKNAEEFQCFLEKYYRIKHISSEETEENEEKNALSLRKDTHKKIRYYSILKKRPIKRISSGKKITFSEKKEMRHYKKD